MINLAADFSMLVSNPHIGAFVLGLAVYLGYTKLPMWRPRASAAAPAKVSGAPGAANRLALTPRRAAAAGATLALLVGLGLSAKQLFGRHSNPPCPLDLEEEPAARAAAPLAAALASGAGPQAAASNAEASNASLRVKLRGPGAWKFVEREAPGGVPEETRPEEALPSVLLARAHAAAKLEGGASRAWPALEACVAWVSPGLGEGGAALSELYAQLECNGELVESGAVTHEAAPELIARARRLVGGLSAHGTEGSTWRDTQVEWARISHGVFQLSCRAVVDELQVSKNAKAQRSPAAALAALRSLRRLEAPFVETLAALAAGSQALEARQDGKDSADASEELQELRGALGADRFCALQALQEGRSAALALPRTAPLVRQALQCSPRLLEAFEALVVREATEATDAATTFGLGLHFSDLGLAASQGQRHPPLFGAPPLAGWGAPEPLWAADAEGTHAPAELVRAEALLAASEEASEAAEAGDRGAARALRLYQHAKLLALKHHDRAAEWRYRAASELAAAHGRQKLAAHALGRLGYFLLLRGRRPEALAAAAGALEHGGEDPLAQYLQASLRRSLGELRSTEEVDEAERQLSVVAGRLPSKTLEDQRAAAHAELGWWRLVATGGPRVCLGAWDAANFLICAICSLVFQVPEVAAPAIL